MMVPPCGIVCLLPLFLGLMLHTVNAAHEEGSTTPPQAMSDTSLASVSSAGEGYPIPEEVMKERELLSELDLLLALELFEVFEMLEAEDGLSYLLPEEANHDTTD